MKENEWMNGACDFQNLSFQSIVRKNKQVIQSNKASKTIILVSVGHHYHLHLKAVSNVRCWSLHTTYVKVHVNMAFVSF